MRVSELITKEEIRLWKPNDIITIKAGTGVGKSYFIKNCLYEIAKTNNSRILMLIHRTNCVNQFQYELDQDFKLDTIDVRTYQSYEIKELKQLYNNISQYKYIVCDEFHYFMSDAVFSKTTDISLNMILKQKNIIKIFMSATGGYMKDYLNNVKCLSTIDYQIPINYKFIKELFIYTTDNTLHQLAEAAIKSNTKTLFFIDSAKKGYDLYLKFKKYSIYNCGKEHKNYKYVDQEEINKLLTNQKFDKLFLITTTCMDTGVNIIDDDLKNIVCDIKDTGTLIQCIGRKRIQHRNDRITIYIKSIDNRALGGKITKLKEKIDIVNFFHTHTLKEFVETYKKQKIDDIIYDDVIEDSENTATKKVNEMMLYKAKNDLDEAQKILSYGKYGYSKYLKELFGIRRYKIVEVQNKNEKMEDYLNDMVGKKLKKEDQKKLIDIIDLRDSRNRQQKTIGQLNEYFKANNLKYLIIQKSSSEMVNGQKITYRYWEIISDVE